MDVIVIGIVGIGIVVLLLYMFSSRKSPAERGLKECPKCAEEVKLEAAVCRHCGHSFEEGGATA